MIFSPVRAKVQELVDRTFYRDRLNYRETLREVSEEITGLIELEPLVNTFARRIRDSLRVTRVAIYLRNRTSRTLPLAAEAGDAYVPAGTVRPARAACRFDTVLTTRHPSRAPTMAA